MNNQVLMLITEAIKNGYTGSTLDVRTILLSGSYTARTAQKSINAESIVPVSSLIFNQEFLKALFEDEWEAKAIGALNSPDALLYIFFEKFPAQSETKEEVES